MSSRKKQLSGDIHIPLCQKASCKAQLTELAAALRNKELTCVTDYRPFGKYSQWFQEAFQETTFTIIHKCPFLWRKMNTCLDLLKESSKIMAIDINPEHSSVDEKEDVDSSFVEFFEDLMTHEVKNKETLGAFLDMITPYLRDECDESEPASEPTENSSNPSGSTSVSGGDDIASMRVGDQEEEEEAEENRDGFKVHPDKFNCKIFSRVFMRSSSISFANHESYGYSEGPCMKMKNTIDGLKVKFAHDKAKILSNLQYILFKVLPDMYEKRMVAGLATLGTCDELSVQSRAQSMLELILFQDRGAVKGLDFSSLVRVESSLSSALQKLRASFAVSHNKGTQLTIQRLCTLYLMVHCEMIMISQDGGEMLSCNTHFSTVIGRPFVSTRNRNRADESLEVLDFFITETNKKSCNGVRARVAEFIKLDNPYQLAKELTRASLSTQTIVTFELLKKVFLKLDLNALSFLEEYVKPTSSTLFRKAKEVPMTCIVILLRGLTHLFSHGLKQAANQDIKLLCLKAMSVMNMASRRDLPNEVGRMMQTLLFDPKPAVRKGIIKFYSERNNYAEVQPIFLQNEVERILCPLLQFTPDRKLPSEKLTGQWTLFSGNFGTTEVLVLIHKPTQVVHMNDNHTRFRSQVDFHHNQMRRLKHLQHKNIVKMFSYQEHCIPQFYVVEDYLTTNFQTALKNRSDNRAFFPRSQLFKFLINACSALEYCHSKDFVHRNVIGSSFFMFGEEIKLCGFQLCVRIVEGQGKAVEQNNVGVPTRWTAPESLEKGEYTRESDVYMFGHLMYEVLTHGLMPYSHIQMSDSEIVPLIIDGNASLCREACIEKSSFKIIGECVQHAPCNRPDMSSLQSMLEDLYNWVSENPSEKIRQYPDLTKGTGRSSTQYKVGAMQHHRAEVRPSEARSFIVLTESRRVFRVNGRLVIQEVLSRSWPPEMKVKIETEVLSSVLPPIKLFKAQNGSELIEFSLPSGCIGNLQEVTVKRLLGKNSPRLYLYCIYQVAVLLENLYSISWVLGDLCASNVYVECLENDVKVHVGSLAHLVFLSQYEENELSEEMPRPTNPDVVARGAPEVNSSGLYSAAADVFNFGNFAWEVLTAYDHKDREEELLRVINDSSEYSSCYSQEPQAAACEHIAKGAWKGKHKKPESCSESFYELIKLCVSGAESNRPTVPHLKEQIKKYCLEQYQLPMEEVKDSSRGEPPETSPSIATLNSSMFELDEMNETVAGSSFMDSDSLYNLLDEEVVKSKNAVFRELIAKSSLVSPSPVFAEEAYMTPRYLNETIYGETTDTSDERIYEDIDQCVEDIGDQDTKNVSAKKLSLLEKKKKFKSFSKDYLALNYSSHGVMDDDSSPEEIYDDNCEIYLTAGEEKESKTAQAPEDDYHSDIFYENTEEQGGKIPPPPKASLPLPPVPTVKQPDKEQAQHFLKSPLPVEAARPFRFNVKKFIPFSKPTRPPPLPKCPPPLVPNPNSSAEPVIEDPSDQHEAEDLYEDI
ncbi:uncharacterized protein LOC101864126 [Aplysia californica]|uniref:Uncharacterized protein LOC101864126 n=1 Tax=Aplysia californica TaxID=6500 RepID=A0ABM0JEC1_APLCA|nr:uncharacterized protein LOC101864126 [Aplysia californica]XP_005091774.1 uncharacterized protein LOC101864126 [Aplysia californica]